MKSHSLSALPVLLALALAPGCDEAGKKDSASDSVADTDPGETEGTTDGSSGGATESSTDGATDGEMATGSTGAPEDPPVKPEPAVACEDSPWDGETCTVDAMTGKSFCIVVDGEKVQTPCYPEPPCNPGDNFDQGCLGSICAWDGEDLWRYDWSEPNCETPLVVDFDRGPLRFDPVGAASFDIGGAGECLATDWPALPWLALDRDGDGVITDGRELFGSGTVLASGRRALDGFSALAELDADHDGRLTPADPAFAELVLWSDRDGDRRGELAELVPIREANLVAIELDYSARVECDARGNCGRERAAFQFRAPTGELRSGEIVDVYLACQ